MRVYWVSTFLGIVKLAYFSRMHTFVAKSLISGIYALVSLVKQLFTTLSTNSSISLRDRFFLTVTSMPFQSKVSVGVYVSFIGAGLTALGGIAKFIVNRMVSGFSSTVTSMNMPFGGGMEIAMQNENGEWVDVPGEVAEEIFGSMGGNVIG